MKGNVPNIVMQPCMYDDYLPSATFDSCRPIRIT